MTLRHAICLADADCQNVRAMNERLHFAELRRFLAHPLNQFRRESVRNVQHSIIAAQSPRRDRRNRIRLVLDIFTEAAARRYDRHIQIHGWKRRRHRRHRRPARHRDNLSVLHAATHRERRLLPDAFLHRLVDIRIARDNDHVLHVQNITKPPLRLRHTRPIQEETGERRQDAFAARRQSDAHRCDTQNARPLQHLHMASHDALRKPRLQRQKPPPNRLPQCHMPKHLETLRRQASHLRHQERHRRLFFQRYRRLPIPRDKFRPTRDKKQPSRQTFSVKKIKITARKSSFFFVSSIPQIKSFGQTTLHFSTCPNSLNSFPNIFDGRKLFPEIIRQMAGDFIFAHTDWL